MTSDRLFTLLLRLYPREFRATYGTEMRANFLEQLDERRKHGILATAALWLRTVMGMVQGSAAERLVGRSQAFHSTGDSSWGRDLRYAVRVLWRSPRFTIAALTLLVLGIGATTAIFPIAYAVLVRPLPYPDPERLVFVAEKNGNGVAWPNFEDWQSRAESFDGLASSLADGVLLTGGPVPRRVESRSVTANFFQVLGVPASQGRLFDDGDAGPGVPATLVVSHEFWVQELGGAAPAIGKTMSVNGKPFVLIGVLPPGFRYMTPADLYLLLEPQVAANYRGMLSRNTHTTLYALGRLKPDADARTAQTEMRAIQAALSLQYPETGDDVQLVPLTERIVGNTKATLLVLAGAVTLLLLITCVNLAGLLLTRGAARARELGIRAAIGGSRWSLVRQLLVEQAVLVFTGGLLGTAVGAAILTGLVRVAPRDLPRLDEIRPDLGVVSLTMLVSCACAFVFAVLPVLRTAGADPRNLGVRSVLGSTRSASLRWGLMTAEIAVATVLLSGSGLMVRTMMQLGRVDPGFDPHDLQTVTFSLSGPAWPDPRQQAFYDAVVERLRAVPGVENAAVTYSLPMLGSNWWNGFTIADTPVEPGAESPNAGMMPVTAGYFETLRIPLLKGRSFDRSDTPDSPPVAIVTSSVAERYWPGADPMGKQIRQGSESRPYGPWRTIVGVVGDVKQHGVDQVAPPQVYMPIVQQPRTTVIAVARTREPVSSASLEAAIHDLDPSLAVFNDHTVEQLMVDLSSRRRAATVVLSVFGAVAILLAAIGLYAVIGQGVAERRQEIGVRVALGATRGQILGLFLRHGLIVVTVGIALGIAASVAAARSLTSLVFGITVTDPPTLGAVVALLTLVTLVACCMPARSAALVDPSEALRS